MDERPLVYLLYVTDQWHMRDSYELRFIGTSVKECVDHAKKDKEYPCTDDQKEQLLRDQQSCCNGCGYEYDIEQWHVGEEEVL